jgi:hypothetical protein
VQGFPGPGGQILSAGFQIGEGFEAEEKADPRIIVPAVQLFGLRELAVAPQQDAAKTTPETNRQGLVDLFGGSFLRGPIARAVDRCHNTNWPSRFLTCGFTLQLRPEPRPIFAAREEIERLL